jgi:hypothetical protein
MKSTRSFATTSSAGVLLALVLATGAFRSFSCIQCELATSYHAAVRVYDRALSWGVIARWWIHPEYAPSARDKQPSAKPEDVCEIPSAAAHAR